MTATGLWAETPPTSGWLITEFKLYDLQYPTRQIATRHCGMLETTLLPACLHIREVVTAIMVAMPSYITPFDSIGGDTTGVLKFWSRRSITKDIEDVFVDAVSSYLRDNRLPVPPYVIREKVFA